MSTPRPISGTVGAAVATTAAVGLSALAAGALTYYSAPFAFVPFVMHWHWSNKDQTWGIPDVTVVT